MYKCNNCGYTTITKLGKCPDCGSFGSFMQDETISSKQSKNKKTYSLGGGSVISKAQSAQESVFWPIKSSEINRVFQKGIKKGGIYLLGGEPGIGKSTIILQIIFELLKSNDIKIGYFSGEENSDQILDRLGRLNGESNNKANTTNDDRLDNVDIYHSTHIEDIITTTEINKYDMIIIDSIQTVYSDGIDSPAGSVNQVKFCSEKISEFCKKRNITGFIIGHVTKSGEIAGPRYLEHIVDVVLYLEGDRFGQYRFLRNKKNRFASTDDVAIFEMGLFGLIPVYDIKDRIISNINKGVPGSIITIGIDDARAIIINLEVLLNKCKDKYPQRTAIGIDNNRLSLIIAILERYLNINLGYFDIFVNIPGEFKFNDSGLDLAVAAGIYSQYKNINIDKNLVFLGELGLGGQVIKSRLHDKRLKELPEGFTIIDFTRIKNIIEIKNIS